MGTTGRRRRRAGLARIAYPPRAMGNALNHEAEESAKHRAKFAKLAGFLDGKLVVYASAAAAGAPLPEGSKRVHFIRHGEGEHNAFGARWKEEGREGNPYVHEQCPVDPVLTAKGVAQAAELGRFVAATFPEGEPAVIYTSPMRRAAATALGAFGHLVAENGPKVLATDLAHELGGLHVCDNRLSRAELAAQFPQVDFSGIAEDDPLWDAGAREATEHMAERGLELLRLIMDSDHDTLAVAAHSAFLLTLFNVSLRSEDAALIRWFETGEMRTVHLSLSPRAGGAAQGQGEGDGSCAVQ